MTATICRPATNLSGSQKFQTPIFAVPEDYPRVPDTSVPGEVLFAAKWAVFEPIALQLMDERDIARWERVSRIFGEWAVREAELNNPETAKHDHSVSIACAQKAELIRMFPGEMTDPWAVLADIFTEQVAR